jgi:hypothetical protein
MPADDVAADQQAVEASGLEKSYGTVRVLAGVDLQVERGSVFALLGPNGAGKTTTVRILATLVRADAGPARVAGFDVVGDRRQVRRAISLTGQFAAVDELQTGQENLRMMGRLVGLSRAQARRRAGELLERFDPADAGGPEGGDVVGRHAPAAGPGRQPGRPPLGRLPGRADHRPGPPQPAGGLAGPQRPRRVGRDHLPDYPVPGGGVGLASGGCAVHDGPWQCPRMLRITRYGAEEASGPETLALQAG